MIELKMKHFEFLCFAEYVKEAANIFESQDGKRINIKEEICDSYKLECECDDSFDDENQVITLRIISIDKKENNDKN